MVPLMHKTASYLTGQGRLWRCIPWKMENSSLQFQFGWGCFSSAEVLLNPDCGQSHVGVARWVLGEPSEDRPGTAHYLAKHRLPSMMTMQLS